MNGQKFSEQAAVRWGMKKNGRPTKYSEETGDKIANFIREGLTIKDACYGVGISDDTFRRWRDKYPDFNKKVVEVSNQQWDSAEAIAKYHSGYRGCISGQKCILVQIMMQISRFARSEPPVRELAHASNQ